MCLCLVVGLPLISVLRAGDGLGALAAGIVAVSIWNPGLGLLVVAGLLPLCTPLAELTRPSLAGQDAGELLLLSLLFAISGSFAVRVPAVSSPLRPAIVASVAVVAGATWVSLIRQPYPAASLAELTWQHVTTAYFVESASFRRLHDGMIWIEGLLLAYMVDLMLRQHRAEADRLSRALLAGIVGASLFTVYRIVEIVAEQHGSARAILASLAMTRIGIHSPDVNAVGSLYALFVVPALWSALVLGRLWRWAAFASILCALWWTGSRAAILAACGGVIVVASLTRTMSRRAITLTVSVSAVVVVLLVLRSSADLNSAINALHIRLEMAKVGILVWAAHPAFGVGPHQVLPASRPLISERALALFPEAAHGENAHNNFIQILAEFGLIGGVVVLSAILLPLVRSTNTLDVRATQSELPGVVGGLYAFLLTCLLGHPFLIPLCLWLFFLMLGLVSGLSPPKAARPQLWEKRVCRLACGVIAVSMPWRIAEARAAPDSGPAIAVDATPIAGTLDGIAFTTIDRVYGLAVPSVARAVTVPLRLTPQSLPSCLVHVSANGRQAGILNPPTDHWLHARYLWRSSPGGASGRLDLAVRQTGCRVMVGQMAVE